MSKKRLTKSEKRSTAREKAERKALEKKAERTGIPYVELRAASKMRKEKIRRRKDK